MSRHEIAIRSYEVLRKKVKETLLLGQEEIEFLKVKTYWQTGELINKHVRLHDERAEYDRQVIQKLADDIGLHVSVLWRCSQFAKRFPILAVRRELSWAHYRTLITIDGSQQRSEVMKRALDQEWSSRELEIKVRDLHCQSMVKATGQAPLLERPSLGPFYTYRIICPDIVHSKSNDLLIDLGFSTVIELREIDSVRFSPETIVTSIKDKKGGYTIKRTEAYANDKGSVKKGPAAHSPLLYTYKAYVERVIDGDTVKVEIDLGFNIRVRQTIRLKSIDCPELDTAEGKHAKKFVEDELEGCDFITIKTTKSDKYDRYLCDIFYGSDNGKYLNQILLDKALAVRVKW